MDKRDFSNLRELIREDYVVTGRDWTKPGFRALAVHRFGVRVMRIRSRWIRAPLSRLYYSLYRYVRNHYGIMIDHRSRVGRRVHIGHQHGITIHPNAVIGDDCIIRHMVTLGVPSRARRGQAPRLGRSVDVGVGAVIVGKVTIGDGAKIGPNAVVTTDVPAGATAFGNPAKVFKPRSAA